MWRLYSKRRRSTKKHFDYEAPEKPIWNRLGATFFKVVAVIVVVVVVVDTAIESLKGRFSANINHLNVHRGND